MARVNTDSKLWEKAYSATIKTKTYKVKQYTKVVQTKPKNEFIFTKSDTALKQRLIELNGEISRLKKERKLVHKEITKRASLKNKDLQRPVSLYALRLQNDCWYIGMSFNVKKRYTKHQKGKGAVWTKRYAPIEIYETRITECYDQDSAAKLEDDMTIEYALKYGSDKVRGGGYCQAKPHWPDVVIENERMKL